MERFTLSTTKKHLKIAQNLREIQGFPSISAVFNRLLWEKAEELKILPKVKNSEKKRENLEKREENLGKREENMENKGE